VVGLRWAFFWCMGYLYGIGNGGVERLEWYLWVACVFDGYKHDWVGEELVERVSQTSTYPVVQHDNPLIVCEFIWLSQISAYVFSISLSLINHLAA
jgi:hypothetical protein